MYRSPSRRRERKRSLPLRALALSLGLHAAAAAAYGGYHLSGIGNRPPRIAFADSGFVAITLRFEPGDSGGHAAGGGAGAEVAAVGAVAGPALAGATSVSEPAPGAPPMQAAPQVAPQLAPPSAALPLIAAAAPAFETAARAVGRSLQDLVEASLASAELPRALDLTPHESNDLLAGPASDTTADARGADVDGGRGTGGGSDSGLPAAAMDLAGDGDGSGAGIGVSGSGLGPSEGDGPGGHEGHAGTRGLGDGGHHPPPDYPQEARHAGQEGVVIVRALTDTDGAVEDVLIEQSSGFPLLDEAALAAVRHWTFEPELDDGVAVASYVLCPIRFTLRR